MFEYGEINLDEEGQKEFRRDHRLSNYLSFSLHLSKQVVFSGTTYVQPVINDFSDIRVSTQNSLLLSQKNKLASVLEMNITGGCCFNSGVTTANTQGSH